MEYYEKKIGRVRLPQYVRYRELMEKKEDVNRYTLGERRRHS
jgi:hypothetical protein